MVEGVKTSPVRIAMEKLVLEWRVASFLRAGSRLPLRLPTTILESKGQKMDGTNRKKVDSTYILGAAMVVAANAKR